MWIRAPSTPGARAVEPADGHEPPDARAAASPPLRGAARRLRTVPLPGSIAAMPRDPDGTFRTLRLRETYGGERPP
ncbi:hypothetical protein SCALM49S_02222 [Streptomyces californicus]